MNPTSMYPNLMSKSGQSPTGGSTLPPDQGTPQLPTTTPDPSQVQSDISSQDMATPEQIQELKDFIATIEEELKKADATHKAGKDADFQIRSQLLNQLFAEMEKQGVDLTSQQSVAMFLTKLKATNPDIANGFIMALEHLMGEQDQGSAAESKKPTVDMISPNATPPDVPLTPNEIKQIKGVKTKNILEKDKIIQSPVEEPWYNPASAY